MHPSCGRIREATRGDGVTPGVCVGVLEPRRE